ncbi:MAG TPA: arylsulfatase, partial [Chitinophagaceae bacterium]|nr:arylsulfatase [Chitinophagaceae bacterium]
IVADDLGYGDLGCYGQQKIQTPNIDKLAGAGMRFTQFYAGTAVCAPSRASLMTGLHTGHTAVRGNLGVKPEGQFPLPASTVTIAGVLQKDGYTTAAFGKWGLGFPGSTGDPMNQGFTDFFGYNCQSLAHNYYPDHLWQNRQRLELPGNLTSDSVYSADLIHQQALRFLKEKHTKPFFLFMPYTLPHAELYGPRDSIYNYYRKQFNEQAVVKKSSKDDYRFEPYPHAAFAAMITRFDHYVGDIMAAVQQQGLADNTLILFTSDNGPHREGGGDPDFFNSSGGLRGIKRDLYEGGIRVPFIAVWKNKIKAGSTSRYTGTFWDLFPTFEEIAGIPVSPGIDGLSFLPVLEGKATPAKQHPWLYWEFHESGGRQAVRMGNWKGVRLDVSTNAHPLTELYDLTKDPEEQHNVAAAHPDIVDRIDRIIQEAHVADKNWPLLVTEIKK